MNNTKKKYSRSHIGEIYTTNEGYKCKVIDGGSKKDWCTILLDDKHKLEVRYGSVKKGKIKNPYHPRVYGIGYIGQGKYTSKNTKIYSTWNNMLSRSYSENCHKNQPTYKNVTVCEEWYNFQNFAKWYETQYKEETWQIDKDLLSANTRTYSPNTCVFMPQALNNFLANTYHNNTSGCIGVSWSKSKNKWETCIHTKEGCKYIGAYKNKQIASLQYKLTRKKEADRWKKEMTGILPQHIVNSIK